MSKKLKIALTLIPIIAIIGIFGYNYILRGGARDLTSEKTDFSLKSTDIISEFNANSELANKKYLDKAIAISGTISAINDTIINLDNTIICSFKTAELNLKINQKAIIKGRFVGYDDLMGELKLDNCYTIKN